ncbi:MAG TPA: LysM peptidoglycan-binding domain-containing protein [Gammaproteobacteria bacterium]|nr:LysM peptidoglycan-binding domain-containing protein [Gammaproteobacteria bacterium]
MTRVFVLFMVVVVLSLSGCARTGHYGEGFYRGNNARWHPGYHTIRHGDTLYSIAFQYGYDYREVARWNGIRPPYHIYPGQRIRLTPPEPAVAQAPPNQPATPRATPKPAPRAAARPPRASPAPLPASPRPAAGRGRIRWQWPASGKLIARFSPKAKGKKGIVIGGRPGQPVTAAADGTVVYAGSGLRGYGQLIIIKHNEVYFSAYAHNRRLRVREEQKVKKGQRIADMGSSGTDRAVLHFEIRRNGIPVNPLTYLPKR